ncbi:MAG: hypothetical protein R3B13_22955 [Polyangiaceae bacterium]
MSKRYFGVSTRSVIVPLLGVALGMACSGEDPPADDTPCVPGTSQACAGPGSCAGYQVCRADGSGFDACVCQDGGNGASAGGGGNHAGGTSGIAGADASVGGVGGQDASLGGSSGSGGVSGGTSGVGGATGGTSSGGSGGSGGTTSGGTGGTSTGGASSGGTGGTAGTGGAGTPAFPCTQCPAGKRWVSQAGGGGACVRDDDPRWGCAGPEETCPTYPGGIATCVAGKCALKCNPGYANCDADPSNGCEEDLLGPSNCGSCGTTCSAGQVCSESLGCVNACAPPETQCGASCVNLLTSVRGCGTCTNKCSGYLHGSATCNSGSCAVTCEGGFSPCGNSCRRLSDDPFACGTCTACPVVAGAHRACSASTCQPECALGFTKCGGTCVDTERDVAHCGGCGSPCAGTCAGGVCLNAFDAVVTTANNASSLIVDQTNLYFLSGSDVMRVVKTGGTATAIASGQGGPKGLSQDATHVYWANNLGGAIMRAPKQGGAAQLVSAASLPRRVFVDGSTAYWVEGPGTYPTVWKKAPKAGGSPNSVYSGAAGFLDVAFNGTHLFGAELKAEALGYFGPVTQLTPTGAVVASFTCPGALCWSIDADQSHLAYAVRASIPTQSSVYTRDLGSAGEKVLRSLQGELLAVTLQDDDIYWQWTGSETHIERADKCGGGYFTVATFKSSIAPMAVDDTFVYWGNATEIRRAPR